jgi:hypothetical protein
MLVAINHFFYDRTFSILVSYDTTHLLISLLITIRENLKLRKVLQIHTEIITHLRNLILK